MIDLAAYRTKLARRKVRWREFGVLYNRHYVKTEMRSRLFGHWQDANKVAVPKIADLAPPQRCIP